MRIRLIWCCCVAGTAFLSGCRMFSTDEVFVPVGFTGVAIQDAINRAYAHGGGRVQLKPGIYHSGTIYLKSGVELNVPKGSVLRGGARPEDYDDVVDSRIGKRPERSDKAFVVCLFQNDVAVSGKGIIDGQGVGFYHEMNGTFFKKPPHPRPRMVEFVGCRNVRFEDVTLKDSPGWTCWMRMCENVVAERVRIDGDQRMINNDGFHIDGCRHVRIRDCNVKSGDDCVVMRAIVSPNGDSSLCEDMVVEDCVLDSACQCVRLGCPSDGMIRNGVFRHLKMTGRTGIASIHPVRYLQEGDHGNLAMENILFEDCLVDCRRSAVLFEVEDGIQMRMFGNVVFRNTSLVSGMNIVVRGGSNTKLQNVRFENSCIRSGAEMPIETKDVEGLVFDKCQVTSGMGTPKPLAVNESEAWERVR